MEKKRYSFTNDHLLIIDKVLDTALKTEGLNQLQNSIRILSVFSKPVEIVNGDTKIVELSEEEINILNSMFDICLKVHGINFFMSTSLINQVLSNPIPVYEENKDETEESVQSSIIEDEGSNSKEDMWEKLEN